MRSWILVLVLGICSVAATAHAEVEPNAGAADAYNAYVEAFKGNNMAVAEAKLKEAIAAQPEWGKPYAALGELYKVQKKYADAVTRLKAATEKMPDDAHVFMSLGDTYRLQGAYSLALPALEKALSLDSTLNDARLAMATASFDDGDYARAAEQYDSYTNRVPGDAQAWLRLAEAQKKLKKSGAAIRAYKAAIKADPKDFTAHYNLGNLYLESEEYADAETEFAEAVKSDPKNFKAQFNLAIAIHSQGRLKDALAAYEKVISIGGDRSAAKGTVASARETIKGLKEQIAAGGE